MSNAQSVSLVKPVLSFTRGSVTLLAMSKEDPRAILAANLLKLIADSPEKKSVRAWALARGLDVRLIDRMTKGKNAPTLDKIDEVAKAVGLPAWQLLLPDFEPGKQLEPPLSSADREMLQKLKRLLS